MNKFPSFSNVILISGILFGTGALGLLIIIFGTLPTLGPRWIFFFLITILLAGLSLPVIHFLHRRFPSDTPVNMNILLRQSLWVGIYIDLLAWLLLGRALNTVRAVFIAIGLLVIEFLLRLRERSEFKPNEPSNE
jgi:hypothetical protein